MERSQALWASERSKREMKCRRPYQTTGKARLEVVTHVCESESLVQMVSMRW